MSVTETTTTSWFSRMKNALVSLLIGPLLVLVAIILMVWNEGNSIKTYRSLAEGAAIVADVPSDTVDPANEGRLVHVTGPVRTAETPADTDFGISAAGAVAINRNVEMYQWVETQSSQTQKDVGGSETTTTTYDYKKEWKSGVVDSSKFKQQAGHENPQPAVSAQDFVVKTADVGAFELDGERLANLGSSSAVPLTADDTARFANTINTGAPVRLTGNVLYVGSSPASPAIGDLKISWQRLDITEASFVAAQTGKTLADYTTSNGYTIFLSDSGSVTAAKMFEDAQVANVIITWAIRIGGLILMFVGFTMLFSIFGVMGDVIPFVGSIVRFGTGLLSFVLTIIIGPVVMAIGWLAYRPFVAIGVIAVGLVIGFGLVYMRRARLAPAPAAASPSAQVITRPWHRLPDRCYFSGTFHVCIFKNLLDRRSTLVTELFPDPRGTDLRKTGSAPGAGRCHHTGGPGAVCQPVHNGGVGRHGGSGKPVSKTANPGNTTAMRHHSGWRAGCDGHHQPRRHRNERGRRPLSGRLQAVAHMARPDTGHFRR